MENLHIGVCDDEENVRACRNWSFSESTKGIEMGMILNSLPDNAVEACQKVEKEKRYIRMSIKRKGSFLLLTVKNSFDGALRQAEHYFGAERNCSVAEKQ